MKICDDENNSFDVYLVSDGTLDTVITINGEEYRFSGEYANYWRDSNGALSEAGLKALALEALAYMEQEEYDELLDKGLD